MEAGAPPAEAEAAEAVVAFGRAESGRGRSGLVSVVGQRAWSVSVVGEVFELHYD